MRVLDDRDLPQARALLDADPVTNVFVAARVEAVGLDSWRLGSEVWGYGSSGSGRIEALCYNGANLVPVNASVEAARAFADRARRQGRRCSSIVGPVDAVEELWNGVRGQWGMPREVRERQPLLATSSPPAIEPDPGVRRVRPDEIDIFLPACVAMYTEEVGVSPNAGGSAALYRARVQESIAQGRAFARIERGRVLYKAEIGAATRAACQLQGVWVDPELRGQGLGATGTAAVVQEALATVAPIVSLYVNDFNTTARAAYRRVGFDEVGTFMSVLF